MEGIMLDYHGGETSGPATGYSVDISGDESDSNEKTGKSIDTDKARKIAKKEKKERKEAKRLRKEAKAAKRADKERRKSQLESKGVGASADEISPKESEPQTPRKDRAKDPVTYSSKKKKTKVTPVRAASSDSSDSESHVLVADSQPAEKPNKKRKASLLDSSSHDLTPDQPKSSSAQKKASGQTIKSTLPSEKAPSMETPKAKKPKKNAKTTQLAADSPADSQPLAGPSRSVSSTPAYSATPLIKVSQNTPTNVFQAPKKAKRTKNPNAEDKDKEASKKETDDELRRRLTTPEAINAYLAEGWRDLKELGRLEGLGILTYRRGKFDTTEKNAIKHHLDLFKTVNKLEDHDLVDIVFAKGSKSSRGTFPKFWAEVAAVAPGRPVRGVRAHVMRELDPRGKKGPWTKDEDRELLRAYEVHPNEWAKIANVVERTETDCRDRYKGQLASDGTRVRGFWTKAEEFELREVIASVNSEIGSDPLGHEAPWDIVAEKMGGKRSRVQCRKKWQGQLCAQARSEAPKVDVEQNDRPYIVYRLQKQNPADASEIEWEKLRQGPLASCPAAALKKEFKAMKKEIPDAKSMTYDDLIKAMASKWLMTTYLKDAPVTPRFKSKKHVEAPDQEGDEEDGPDGNVREEGGEEENVDGEL